jgi:hypothetical protein
LLGAVQYAQYLHCIADDTIGRDVGCAIDNQFACPVNSARTAHLWELRQALHARLDTFIGGNGGLRAIPSM